MRASTVDIDGCELVSCGWQQMLRRSANSPETPKPQLFRTVISPNPGCHQFQWLELERTACGNSDDVKSVDGINCTGVMRLKRSIPRPPASLSPQP